MHAYVPFTGTKVGGAGSKQIGPSQLPVWVGEKCAATDEAACWLLWTIMAATWGLNAWLVHQLPWSTWRPLFWWPCNSWCMTNCETMKSGTANMDVNSLMQTNAGHYQCHSCKCKVGMHKPAMVPLLTLSLYVNSVSGSWQWFIMPCRLCNVLLNGVCEIVDVPRSAALTSSCTMMTWHHHTTPSILSAWTKLQTRVFSSDSVMLWTNNLNKSGQISRRTHASRIFAIKLSKLLFACPNRLEMVQSIWLAKVKSMSLQNQL